MTTAQMINGEIGAKHVSVKIGDQELIIAYPMAAVLLYKKLTGDNLFQLKSWDNADLRTDPERFITLLWCGLHRFDGDKYIPAISLDALTAKMAKLPFGKPISALEKSVVEALTAYMPRVPAKTEASENPQTPPAP